MKLTPVEELKELDILGIDVLNSDYTVLLAADTELTKEHISRLKSCNIREVYVRTEDVSGEVEILKEDVRKEVHDTLRKIMEKHTYTDNSELSKLSETADVIISNILEEEDVVEKLYDIRRRSADIYEHCISVCSISTLIALKRKKSETEVHDIGVACLLHEIGLQNINLDYENKEIYDMEPEDAEEYKKHPLYAYERLRYESWLSEESKNMILWHHERMDGSGFPRKMMGIDMSDSAKIIQVCDAFDEFICGIGCERVKVYEALEYLKIYKGTKFEKDIVEDFLELIAVYPVGSYVRTSDGETAVVLRQNREFPDRPVVRIIKNKEGEPVKKIIIKDLLKYTTLFIEDID
ncbi:MAG: HD domain-containing protein [Lachnospiraceae bacterium]|nr:HD domain-containing protein [Lachnospiraceae bacterium]